MRAYVDQEECIGCGMCEGICSAHFRMNDDGKAEYYGSEAEGTETDEVQEAIESCPVSAISEEE